MEFLTELWLPILVAAVFVFIISSITHMVLPYHKSDYRKLGNEEAILEAMRANGVSPGTYMFPNCESMKEMGSPEMKAKFEQGPVGWMTILTPGPINMGRSLGLWFVYLLIANVFIAYVGWNSLGAHDDYLTVFRVAGSAAVLAYALGVINDSIWKGQSWSTTCKFVFDGVLYALATAGVFGWLWPSA